MGEEVVVYEAGVRFKNGNYARFIESRDEGDVDQYIDIMQTTKPEGSVCFYSYLSDGWVVLSDDG